VRAQSASAGASNGAAPSEAAVAKQVVVVAGPTGVGKTRLAVSLAQRLGGEVVSADAVQVYSPLRVGANVDEAAMLAVPHHLVGHVVRGVGAQARAGARARRLTGCDDGCHSDHRYGYRS
jgi:DNA polymerase III delta prime subunit